MIDILCWVFSIFTFLAGMGSERIDLIFAAAFFLLVSAINQSRYKHYSFELKPPKTRTETETMKEMNQSPSNEYLRYHS